MPCLIFVTFLWAFSFPLIGYFISGQMDVNFAAFFRVFLAFLIFLPFLNFKIKNSFKFKLMGIGALQIGIMYLCYYRAFAFLSVSEVALFTIFTPFYVSLIYDLFSKRFRAWYILSILLCILGAAILKYGKINADFLIGFLWVQGANFVFGAGQSLYKFLMEKNKTVKDINIFGYFHLGAMIVTGITFLIIGDFNNLPKTFSSWAVLIYLGIVASGIGYLLWNKGAVLVDSGFLAIMNNALIPAAILVDLIFYYAGFSKAQNIFETLGYFKISTGIFLMGLSLWVHQKIINYYDKIKQV